MAIRLINFTCILFFLCIITSVRGEVYWLRDVGNSIKLNPTQKLDIEQLLAQEKVFEDPLIINGYSTVMEVGNSQYNFGEILQLLHQIDDRLITVIDDSNLVFTIDLNDKYVQKFLISNVGRSFNAMIFSMKLPKKLPKAQWKGIWSKVLGGGSSELVKIIEYPNRKATYITVANVKNPTMEMDYVRRYFHGKNFRSLSSDDKSFEEKSDVFLNEKTGEIIAVSFDDKGNGFIYYKEEQKWD